MTLEETLGGGYSGLFGEVVDKDHYHMRDVADIVSINDPNFVHEKGHKRAFDFTPATIFDVGCNIGIFSRYCRKLFPDALIISVEPDKSNCEIFKEHTKDEKIILIEKAIGSGKIYRCAGAKNGSAEVYLSVSLGYPQSILGGDDIPETNIEGIMLPELKKYIREGGKTILKLDCEGNETVIFCDKPSMDFLKTIDYLVMELHYYSHDHESNRAVAAKTVEALFEFNETHTTWYDHVYFYAVKK